jgi:hypothetical protein
MLVSFVYSQQEYRYFIACLPYKGFYESEGNMTLFNCFFFKVGRLQKSARSRHTFIYWTTPVYFLQKFQTGSGTRRPPI